MAVQLVFNGILNPATVNLSVKFTDAIAFYIEAPILDGDVEIDVFLQLYLPNNKVRNIPLGKLEEQAILLNQTDTETASFIPYEYQDTTLEMALLFLPSEAFTLQAFVITKEVTLLGIQDQLAVISQQILDLATIDDFSNIIDNLILLL